MTTATKTICEKLAEIQAELSVPKGQRNTFGNYNYRSCEDILDAVKPFLKDRGLVLTISDDLIQIGDRYYIKATATIGDGDKSISNTAWAREEESKKGMDAAQVTGSTSSYARKYALNGLFCIDDVKDADTQDNRNEGQKKAAPETNGHISMPQVQRLHTLAKKNGWSGEDYKKELKGKFGFSTTKDIPLKLYDEVCERFSASPAMSMDVPF